MLQSNTTVAPPEHPYVSEPGVGLGSSSVIATMQCTRHIDDTPNQRMVSSSPSDKDKDSETSETPEKQMNEDCKYFIIIKFGI